MKTIKFFVKYLYFLSFFSIYWVQDCSAVLNLDAWCSASDNGGRYTDSIYLDFIYPSIVSLSLANQCQGGCWSLFKQSVGSH